MNAQTFVCKMLEDRWWSGYKAAWNDEKLARAITSATTAETPNANISYGKDYRSFAQICFAFSVPILISSFESDKFYGVRKADVYIFDLITTLFQGSHSIPVGQLHVRSDKLPAWVRKQISPPSVQGLPQEDSCKAQGVEGSSQ